MSLTAKTRSILTVAMANRVAAKELADAVDASSSSDAAVSNGTFDAASSANKETSTTDASALSVSKLVSYISASTGQSRTLAAPTADGQLKMIEMTVHGGDVTLAGTNIWGQEAATGTFNAVGDSIVLLSLGGKWLLVASNSVTFA